MSISINKLWWRRYFKNFFKVLFGIMGIVTFLFIVAYFLGPFALNLIPVMVAAVSIAYALTIFEMDDTDD